MMGDPPDPVALVGVPLADSGGNVGPAGSSAGRSTAAGSTTSLCVELGTKEGVVNGLSTEAGF